VTTLVQFVDSIASSPTVRLDINSYSGGLMISDDGIDLSPPPLSRAVASTLLVDGDRIVASAYGNRTIKLTLRPISGVGETVQTLLQDLAQELDRPDNFLKVLLHGMTSPVFFRTYRASDYTLSLVRTFIASGQTSLAIEIPAEPFGLGLMETITPVAVQNDPAAGSNGKFMDITGVKGDVETPLFLKLPGTSVSGRQGLFAVRRRGTPSAMPYLLQAESMTMGTDTALGTNSAAYSGTLQNNTVTTFATVTTSVVRLSTTLFPASPSVDVRGTYRVFVRLQSNVASAAFKVKLEHGVRAVVNTEVAYTMSASGTYQAMVDLGLVQIPEGYDPVYDGPTGVPLQVNGIPLKLYASRTSGSGSLTIDYFLLVPADDKLSIVSWGSSSPTSFVFDGVGRAVYGVDSSNRVTDLLSAYFVGDPPTISPNVTNRLCYINDVSPTNVVANDQTPLSVTISPFYWPRYLTIRPAST
jgi:hypothetical protein